MRSSHQVGKHAKIGSFYCYSITVEVFNIVLRSRPERKDRNLIVKPFRHPSNLQ
jgi:hypothetical protein